MPRHAVHKAAFKPCESRQGQAHVRVGFGLLTTGIQAAVFNEWQIIEVPVSE
jgi:hypothetical protein